MRYFTVIDFPKKGDSFGVFRSSSPKQAANRAFTKLSKIFDIKNKDNKWLVFNLQEIHIANANKIIRGKTYKYIGTRVELVKPIIRNINGKTVKYKYKNIVGSYKNYFA